MNQLERLRKAAGLTQSELADKIDSQQPQIARWESDIRKVPVEWAIKLGTFFNCHPGTFRPELLGDGLDALLGDADPDIRRQVREYAEFLLKKSRT